MRQYGPQPHLPEPHQFLLPPMSVPRGGGLEAGRGPPVVAAGLEGAGHRYPAPAPAHCLRIERRHPGGGEERPRQRPLQAQGLHPGQGEGARWGRREGRQPAHPLLGDTNGDGLPEPRTVLLDHLYSPYGVAHVGDTLYVADTDGYPTPAEARTAASMASASWARR